MDSVSPQTSLLGLCDQHISETPVRSLAELERRHSGPGSITQQLFAFNTFLMDIPGAGRKPAVEYRDAEIGHFVSARSDDLVALSEVWHKEERDDLLGALDFDAYVSHRSGSGGVNVVRIGSSAGLVTLSRSLPVARDHSHTYDAESGSDKHAAKGCLLTVLQTGHSTVSTPSSLNLYSTHLNAGGPAKYDQIPELVSFIWRTMNKIDGNLDRPGRPGVNGNVLVGDFNLDRYDTTTFSTVEYAESVRQHNLPDEVDLAIRNAVREDGTISATEAPRKNGFQLLSDMLAALGFRDVWKTRNGSAGYTSDLMNPGVIDAIARPAEDDETLCDDRLDLDPETSSVAGASAIDHIFYTPTTDAMGFTLDLSRPRRPRSVRPEGARDRDDISFMSDHLGIETTLFMAPKS